MTPGNQVGVRFMLRGGAFLDVIQTTANANAILHNWKTRYYHLKNIEVIDGTCLSGTDWCVNRDDITAIHTARLDQQPQAAKSVLSGVR